MNFWPSSEFSPAIMSFGEGINFSEFSCLLCCGISIPFDERNFNFPLFPQHTPSQSMPPPPPPNFNSSPDSDMKNPSNKQSTATNPTPLIKILTLPTPDLSAVHSSIRDIGRRRKKSRGKEEERPPNAPVAVSFPQAGDRGSQLAADLGRRGWRLRFWARLRMHLVRAFLLAVGVRPAKSSPSHPGTPRSSISALEDPCVATSMTDSAATERQLSELLLQTTPNFRRLPPPPIVLVF